MSLLYSVVVSYRLPNTFPGVTCKHNLETSSLWRYSFSVRLFWKILVS